VAAYLVPQVMAYAEVAGLPAVAGLWSVVGPLTLYAPSTALMTATAVSVVAAGQMHQLGQRCRRLAMAVGAICLLVPPRLGRPPRLSRQVAVSAGADRLHELMIVRQLGNLTSAPVDGGSVTHQMRSVVTHLQLVHPPTLTVGSAVLAVVRDRLAFSALFGSVDRDDPGWRMRGVVRSRKQRDPHRWRRLIARRRRRCRCSPVKGRPDKGAVKTGGAERDSACPRYKPARARLGDLSSEDRDCTCRSATVWDALFGCVRAARVQAEAAHRRPVTRERMVVPWHGSND
jgi:hypothetical protein